MKTIAAWWFQALQSLMVLDSSEAAVIQLQLIMLCSNEIWGREEDKVSSILSLYNPFSDNLYLVAFKED